jgi:hypothetical protein
MRIERRDAHTAIFVDDHVQRIALLK